MSYTLELYAMRAAYIITLLFVLGGVIAGEPFILLIWKMVAFTGFAMAAFAWRNCLEVMEANNRL